MGLAASEPAVVAPAVVAQVVARKLSGAFEQEAVVCTAAMIVSYIDFAAAAVAAESVIEQIAAVEEI
jgi:hypothetical protein